MVAKKPAAWDRCTGPVVEWSGASLRLDAVLDCTSPAQPQRRRDAEGCAEEAAGRQEEPVGEEGRV